jgi:RNAse (barnase) inhibitor barstar
MKLDYTLDFTGVKYYLEFHERIQESLEFPDYYGMNYDALWDCIRELGLSCDTHIVVKGTSTLSKELTEAARKVIDIFDEASEKMSGFSYEVTD